MGISVTLDEADKKREYERILMRRGQGDRTEVVNGDKKFRYKLSNSKERAIRHNEALGFEKVPSDDPAQLRYGRSHEGGQILGEDLILMREPRDLYEAKVAKNVEEGKRREGAINETARDKIERLARDEGRSPAHKSVTFDNSKTGETFMAPAGKPKS